MMLKQCITLLLPLFIILPILEARLYNGYDSYREYYKTRVNGVYSMASKMTKQSNEEKNIQEVKYFEENRLSKQGGFNSDVIFSDDDRLRTLNGDKNYAEIRVSEKTMLSCGKDQLFCENVQNYPKEFVNRILKENFDLHIYAFEDAAPIDARLDDDDDDVTELCLSTGHDIVPEAAKSMNGEWMFIVQSKEMNFKQRIHIETCQEQNSTCQIINDKLPEGYFPRCKQKYIYRQLVAINDNMETVQETFQFPVNCCCHLYFHTN